MKTKIVTLVCGVILGVSSMTAEPGFPVLTPKPKAQPRINGPMVYGARPSHPFMYRIPCQGERPIQFTVKNLPKGMQLDVQTGIITGITPKVGEYKMKIIAVNSKGKSTRTFKLISGDKLSLTPSMGWNHWYAHYDRVTDAMIREAADVMISSGMADVGYQYVNIDDCWMNAPKYSDTKREGPARDASGNLLPNSYFPDMNSLTKYIHEKGLLAGIYTSPGKLTCGGFTGAYGFEEKDAKQFADWGFDFLKYDWCSYGDVANNGWKTNPAIPATVNDKVTLEGYKYPYKLMGDFLKKQNRDILFNLCQYGMGNVWKWGEEIGGQSWRTAGDLGYSLDKIYDVALQNISYGTHSKPGSWNDPDYIQIGYFGAARDQGLPQKTKMPAQMQYSYMSLWCMMAAPLFYSGDMSKLDEFTLNVLCNPEIIEVDQDPLGECAKIIRSNTYQIVLEKNMYDGAKIIGVFNRSQSEQEIMISKDELHLKGNYQLRDLWKQEDIGKLSKNQVITLPAYGVAMLRVTK